MQIGRPQGGLPQAAFDEHALGTINGGRMCTFGAVDLAKVCVRRCAPACCGCLAGAPRARRDITGFHGYLALFPNPCATPMTGVMTGNTAPMNPHQSAHGIDSLRLYPW